MEQAKKNYKRLNIVRMVSCILVLLYHLNIVKGGFLAVCTFFVLSGYLRFKSAFSKPTFSISKYYSKRIKKIYLPLLIIIFLTIIVAKQIESITWVNLKPESISALLGYNNFWQLEANLDYFTRHVNSPFMHFWYIAILIQFDLIFPLFYFILNKLDETIDENASIKVVLGLSILSIIIFITLGFTKGLMFAYYHTLARVFSILLGGLLALIHCKFGNSVTKIFYRQHSLLCSLYLIVLIVMSLFNTENTIINLILLIISTIVSVRLIDYSIVSNNRRMIYDENKCVSFISKISYEIYLVQYPIIFFMQNININSTLKATTIIIITIILSYLLNELLRFKSKKRLIKIIQLIIILIILIIGITLLLLEKDHTNEMNELQQKLEENSTIMEQNNNHFLENADNFQQETETVIVKDETTADEIVETTEEIVEPDPNLEQIVHNLPVVGVGDSVLLGAVRDLHKQFPNGYFDGKVSRNLKGGEDVLKDLINKGKLGDTVIVALANNGEFSSKRIAQFLQVLGDRQIYWVNAVGADDPEYNARFEEFAKDYPNVHIVDWYSTAKPEYLYADKVHPKEGIGTAAYAQVIFDTIYKNYRQSN